ncbi:GLPGLI family protein [Flavobacterium hauense]
MKKIAAFLLLLNTVLTFAQGSDVQVEYQAFFNTHMPMKMYTTLYVSGNVAVYREKYSTKEEWTEKVKPQEPLPPGAYTSTTKATVADDDYYKIDRNKKEVLFYDNIMSNKMLVRDTYPELIWQITDETKTVAGLSCIKAVTNFRGREWIAWFAPEVPLAFGPWKLQGLPGIILEAYDSTNKYTMKAIKVEYKKSDMVSKDFTKIYETMNSKPMSYQKFLQDNEEAMDNAHAEIAQKLKGMGGTITRTPVPRSGEELSFEWEKL